NPKAGDWYNQQAGTFDMTKKYQVSGSVAWNSVFTETIQGDQRVLTGNDLPQHPTGIFPIQSTDTAYQYDPTPLSITAHTINISIPANATVNAQPSCARETVGFLLTGVWLNDAFDCCGRDAVSLEMLDSCWGHPNPQGYHHHSVPPCLQDNVGTHS